MTKRTKLYISKEDFRMNQTAYKKIMPESRFKVLQMRFEQEKSVREIANNFQVSTTRIYQLIAHAFDFLEKAGCKIPKDTLD